MFNRFLTYTEVVYNVRNRLFVIINTYSGEAVGWAGLCFEPTSNNPGPFDCTDVEECMQFFKDNPEEYWAWRINNC